MVRPPASSFQRAVRFNALLLKDSASDDSVDELSHDDRTAPSVIGRSKINILDVDDDTYVEFRRAIHNTPSTRNLVVNEKTASSAADGEAACQSPPFANELVVDAIRDDEPTQRGAKEDDYVTPRSPGTYNAFSWHSSDDKDIKVVCKRSSASCDLEVQTFPNMPNPSDPTDVVIAVEASSVSAIDSSIRYGIFPDGECPDVGGCDVVGTTVRCGDEAFLSKIGEGERVASVIQGGGHARYVVVKADQLVKVQDDIDASEAAAIIWPYTVGFQALHSGLMPPQRYSTSALKGKSILVAENMGLVGIAIANLAELSGSGTAYIVCPPSQHDRIKSFGAVPLEENATPAWTQVMEEKIDILIETGNLSSDTYLAFKESYLKTSGRIVRLGTPTVVPKDASYSSFFRVPTLFKNFCTQSYLMFTVQASYYDIYFNLHKNKTMFKNDLSHILHLLSCRKIRPNIEKFVLLKDVPECYDEMEKKHFDKAIVCEPWRRSGFDNVVYDT